MTTKYIYIGILIFYGLLLFSSCKKFVNIDPPKDKIDPTTVFKDSINANAAIVGIYIKSVGTSSTPKLLGGSLSIWTGLSSDELFVSGSTDAGLTALYSNSLTIKTDRIASVWAQAYDVIYETNACLEGINQSSLTQTIKNQFLGECLFLRAINYFYLINLYSDVPLILSTDYRENSILPKTNKEDIYKQILSDLKEAEQYLPEKYISTGRMRLNKYGVTAMLARIYLYQKKWNEAEQAASQVISNINLYKLETDLNNVFTVNSMEAILQFQPLTENQGTPEGYAFVPSSPTTTPKYGINKTLLDSFETNDQRKIKWVQKLTKTVGGVPVDYYYPFKFKYGNSAPSPWPEGTTVLRLGELYLIRAESRAQQDKLFGQNSAESDLNAIRNRAGLSNTKAATKEQMIDAIIKERKVELFCEWGHRWLDLKRTDRIKNVMAVITPIKGGTWKDEWQYYPIPSYETDTNPFLKQNPGYE